MRAYDNTEIVLYCKYFMKKYFIIDQPKFSRRELPLTCLKLFL
ncbi:MAG: hypothetical protein BMS9Abin15_0291 [Gammaproteobacteria bacterium]|nr:MAG: hypothetical protein BMS9Abin15_0291 [Gammaproteobacteria bacterium]